VSLPAKSRSILLACIPLAALACAAAVMSVPPDARLGAIVRFAMFHGAATWVNMGTFTLAGFLGIAYVLGASGMLRWGQALRWISIPLWTVNTVLGVLSMQLIWGGILWSEPRLPMTFGVLAGSVVVLAGQLIADDPKVPAALDALLAASLWFMILALPNLFHPDSPVFSSGDPAYILGFLGMVGSLALGVLVIVVLVARRPARAEASAE